MPLIQGYSKESLIKNHDKLVKEGKPDDQAWAIAYSIAGAAKERASKKDEETMKYYVGQKSLGKILQGLSDIDSLYFGIEIPPFLQAEINKYNALTKLVSSVSVENIKSMAKENESLRIDCVSKTFAALSNFYKRRNDTPSKITFHQLYESYIENIYNTQDTIRFFYWMWQYAEEKVSGITTLSKEQLALIKTISSASEALKNKTDAQIEQIYSNEKQNRNVYYAILKLIGTVDEITEQERLKSLFKSMVLNNGLVQTMNAVVSVDYSGASQILVNFANDAKQIFLHQDKMLSDTVNSYVNAVGAIINCAERILTAYPNVIQSRYTVKENLSFAISKTEELKRTSSYVKATIMIHNFINTINYAIENNKYDKLKVDIDKLTIELNEFTQEGYNTITLIEDNLNISRYKEAYTRLARDPRSRIQIQAEINREARRNRRS